MSELKESVNVETASQPTVEPENQISDDEDDDEKLTTNLKGINLTDDPAKKKKKKKKKKKTDATADGTPAAVSTNGSQPQSKPSKTQTSPPTIPICELYSDGNYPVGEILDYPIPKDTDAYGLY